MIDKVSGFFRQSGLRLIAAAALAIAATAGVTGTLQGRQARATTPLAASTTPIGGIQRASTLPWADSSGLPLPVKSGYLQTFRANEETYVVAADGAVYHNYLDGGRWVGWSSLGRPASGLFGDVSWGTNYLGNQELYVRANDGQVYHLYASPGQGSGWQGWDTMGSPSAGIRGDVHQGTNYLGNQELYVVGNDASVYHTYSTPGQGSGWSEWITMGGPAGLVGDVSVTSVVGANQTLSVVASRIVYSHTATPGAGHGWGGWVPGAPASINPMVAMVNQERATAGIGAVTENAALDAAAAGQAQYQADNQIMSHTGANGSNPGQRITASGYTWWAWGENVAAGQRDATSVLTAWMNSPDHRALILSANFTNIGIAQATGANGAIYWTMELAAPS